MDNNTMEHIEYIAVIQCAIVQQRCSGYFCEKAFSERSGGFTSYPKDKNIRIIYLECGGCCGKAVARKLENLTKNAVKRDGLDKSKIMVQLASCITKDNHHSDRCPHIDLIKTQIKKAGYDFREDTKISLLSEKRRKEGIYKTYD